MPGQVLLGEDVVDIQSFGTFFKSMPARLLDTNLNINALRTNTLLRADEWRRIDARVVAIAANVLRATADLQQLGLVTPLGGLGVMLSQYEQVSDMSEANVNMAVETDDEEDRLDFPLVSVPVPIISKGFRIDARSLAASRNAGSALDTTHIETATRKVAEKLEEIFFLGSTAVARGSAIYGVLNHPNRNIVSGGADWDTSTNVYPNVVAMIGALEADNYFGPYRMYVNPVQFNNMRALSANTAVPILDVVRAQLGGQMTVVASPYVTAGTAVLVNMTSDVVDLAVGQEITPVEWETRGGLVTHYKILTAQIPRVKSDQSGHSGVATMTGI